jgi:uncharacterized protein (DUF1697 family)
MQGLSQIFKALDCQSVKTYIQSGNIVFNTRIRSVGQFADAIGKSIEKEYGFRPAIQLITAEALKSAIDANPYPLATSEPKSLHLFFLDSSPKKVGDSHIYLHAPQGIAPSKFAKGIDRIIHMPTTARNWRTVTKLAELASAT